MGSVFRVILLVPAILASLSSAAQTSPWKIYEPTTTSSSSSSENSSNTAKPSNITPQVLETTPNTSYQYQNVEMQTSTSAALQGRNNALECSPDEVQMYFEQPDRAREVLNQYESFERSYQQVEVKRSESDPAACLGMLYGDLSAMAEQMQGAVSGILSGGMPDFGALAQAAMDKLGESICKRVQQSSDAVQDRIISETNQTQRKARNEVVSRYGQRAMERYVNQSVLPPEFNDAGLKYKNGSIDDSGFRRKANRKWDNELKELEDSAVDSIKD